MDNLVKNYHSLSKEKQQLVKLLLKEQGIDFSSLVILPQKRDKGLYPLSFAQQRLWFLEKFEPNSSLYIIPMGVKIKGELNIDYLLEALQLITNRHEILRTRFIEENGVGYQCIVDDVKISPKVIYLTSASDYEQETNKIMQEEFATPFDLSECPLFRVTIIKVSSDYNILLLPMHHIISDNWSMAILLDEILKIYDQKLNQLEPELDELKVQYIDYALWQKEWLKSDASQIQLKYWKEQLKDSNDVLDIVPDKPKPLVQSYNGSAIYFNLDENLTIRLESFCKRNNITAFTIFLSVYQLMLSRYSRQNDINIGVPVASRNRMEIEPLIGFFINTLVMRSKIDFSNTVLEYLSINGNINKHAYENQDVPFEMIVDDLDLERDITNTALFQAMLVLNNAQMRELKFKGLEFTPIDYDTKTTKFNLVLSLTKQKGIYNCKFEYNTDLFYQSTIEEYSNQFVELLKLFIDKPEAKLSDIFNLQSNKIISIQTNICQSTGEINERKFIHQTFSEIAKNSSKKIAITDGAEKITYEELECYSNSVAKILINQGIKIETPIGVFLSRKIDYVIAILAIFKSGGTFVPLDVTVPEDRLNAIIDNAGITTIIADSNDNLKFVNKINLININDSKAKDEVFIQNKYLNHSNAAYIIYTSGSSGLPKGVVVQHDKFYYHIQQIFSTFNVEKNDKYLAFAAFNFDPSLEQIFAPLLAGATVYLRGDQYWTPSKFLDIIINEQITVINPPTVYWNQFVHYLYENNISDLGSLRLVIAGGEEMKPDMLNKWLSTVEDKVNLINAYGPTETIITSAIYKLSINDNNHLQVPIGKVIGNRKGYVVDSELNLLGSQMPGELCIGGELFARCYKGDPKLTAEKFIPDPFSKLSGSRLYRTGDLVSYDQNGNIKYLGRMDNQIKVRGFRIELSEIENVLSEKITAQTIATVVKDDSGINKIIVYIVDNGNKNVNEKELREYCTSKLPSYMVPSRIITIHEVPLNNNGKLDKNKLPKLELNIFDRSSEYLAPRSDLENEIAKIIANILSIEKVGVFDNFFELGGHSILAIKVVSEVKQNFGVDIELINLFQNPTVEGLAEALVDAQSKLIDNDDLESLLDELESV